MRRYRQRTLAPCGSGTSIGRAVEGSPPPVRERGPSTSPAGRALPPAQDVLVWEALVSLPWQPQYTYRYALVHGQDEEGEPVEDKREMCDHVLVLPDGLKHDDIIEVCFATLWRSTAGLRRGRADGLHMQYRGQQVEQIWCLS